jgi:hypothetical protein
MPPAGEAPPPPSVRPDAGGFGMPPLPPAPPPTPSAYAIGANPNMPPSNKSIMKPANSFFIILLLSFLFRNLNKIDYTDKTTDYTDVFNKNINQTL